MSSLPKINIPGANVEVKIGCALPLIWPIPLILILCLEWFSPSTIPFDLFQFWGFHGSFFDMLADIWPVLISGLALALISLVRIIPFSWEILESSPHWIPRLVFAGVIEEPIFRWIYFYSAIALLPILDYCLFGFMGFGLPQWFFLHVGGPVADFLTFSKLHPYLFDSQNSWVIGAAILSANGKFQGGHAYQGLLGWLWSWFFGIFMFLVMFRYGLFAAMLIHVLYNTIIAALTFLTAYVSEEWWF